jgi:hypothetical protein
MQMNWLGNLDLPIQIKFDQLESDSFKLLINRIGSMTFQ